MRLLLRRSTKPVRAGAMPAVAAASIATIGLAACVDPAPAPATDPDAIVRTANPFARGLDDSDFPRLQELAPGVFSYEQLRSAGSERFTTVSLFVVTDEGVLVADGQGSVAETERLVATIASVTDRPITHVVVCSDHGDHTAGNSAFPADALVYAHPTSRAALERAAARADPSAEAPPVVIPTEMVETVTTLILGGREIRLLFLGRAHTGGDLVVLLPAERILFMSEAFLNRVFPAMRAAYPSEWVAMIERAQALDVDLFVPGHGFVDPPAVLRQELETYRSALVRVIDEVARHHDAGLTLEEAVEAASFGDLDSWSLRDSQRPIAIRRVYAELDGDLGPGG